MFSFEIDDTQYQNTWNGWLKFKHNVKHIIHKTFYQERLTGILTWVRNHTHDFTWGAITYPCPNFN